MIQEAEQHSKHVKKNIFRSLQRVRPEYLLGYENITVIPREKQTRNSIAKHPVRKH